MNHRLVRAAQSSRSTFCATYLFNDMRWLQNTSFLTGLLLAWHASEIVSGKSINDCEIREFMKCHEVYLDEYRKANRTEPLENIYCKSYKGIGRCLMSNLGCSGEFIDEFRFIALQHMIVDDKLGVCVHPDLSNLEQVFRDKEQYFTKIAGWKDLEADDFAPCAAQTNRYCATKLAQELMSNKKMCRDILHFRDCYHSSPFSPCEDKIYKDFVHDMTMDRDLMEQKYKKELQNLDC